MYEVFSELIKTFPTASLIGLITLVQITPIEINPWTWFAKIVRSAIGIDDVQKELQSVKMEVSEERAATWRWNILSFSNSCRNKQKHTREEWNHVVSSIAMYEKHCKDNNITNGVIEEESRYLLDLHQDILRNNEFL